MIDEAFTAVEAATSTATACRLLGVSRARVYRRRSPRLGPPRPPGGGRQPTELTATERQAVLTALDSDRFADKSPAQVWAVLLDEGIYLGSVSTLYRVLRDAQQVRERRAQASHPARVRPELVATGPDQVWTWDITKLKGPTRGVYFDAYVIIDIYSRKVPHFEVHTRETAVLARDFLDRAIMVNRGTVPRTIHSDNGTSMTSKNVAALLSDLHIERSLSRPHTSNDNPYSESAFKTFKYCPAFPENFGGLDHARAFTGTFFDYYNNTHRHSGIGLYTPASVHDGSWRTVQAQRQNVLDAAWTAHPDRFRRGRPTAPTVPLRAWINQPPASIETEATVPIPSRS